MLSKLSKSRIDNMNDLDLLDWFHDQDLNWRESFYDLSKAKTLKETVDFIRSNYEKIKQIEKEKIKTIKENKKNK